MEKPLNKMEKQDLLEKGKYKKDTQLNRIETRLSNVEETLQTILDKGDQMEENLQEKINDVMEKVAEQTIAVRRMQRKLTQKFTSKTMLFMIISGVIVFIILLRIYT